MLMEQWTITDIQDIRNVHFLYFAFNTAWTWDVITSISDEVNMFKGRRIVYRWVDGVFLTGLMIYAALPFVALPLEHCTTIIRAIGWLGGISGSLTTLLFLFRVNSVFHNSVPAKVYFSCMWAVAAVGHLIFPLSLTSQSIGPDALCVVESVKKFGLASAFVVATFDWMAFFSISFRIIQSCAPSTSWRGKCKIFITGEGTTALPRILLCTGNLYILPLLCIHLSVLWAAFSTTLKPSASYQYQTGFIFAAILAMNSMACRIFRLLRELMVDEETVHLVQMSTIHFTTNPLRGVITPELLTEREIP